MHTSYIYHTDNDRYTYTYMSYNIITMIITITYYYHYTHTHTNFQWNSCGNRDFLCFQARPFNGIGGARLWSPMPGQRKLSSLGCGWRGRFISLSPNLRDMEEIDRNCWNQPQIYRKLWLWCFVFWGEGYVRFVMLSRAWPAHRYFDAWRICPDGGWGIPMLRHLFFAGYIPQICRRLGHETNAGTEYLQSPRVQDHLQRKNMPISATEIGLKEYGKQQHQPTKK